MKGTRVKVMINVYVFELDGSKFYTEFNLGGFDIIRYIAHKLNRTIKCKYVRRKEANIYVIRTKDEVDNLINNFIKVGD